jgi:ankyrin repeat protein
MTTVRVLIIRIILLAAILLRMGIINAQWQIVDSLLNNGLISIDTSGYYPYLYDWALDYNLMIAASEGYPSEIERLIAKGADIDAETDLGATPLIFAVNNNKLAAVRTLLYYGPDLNKVTSSYETPLIISVKNRNFEITEALIRAGADLNYPDKQGTTPLHHATLYGYTEIVDLLLYYDASVDAKTEEGTTPLLAAIWAGYPDIADILIQNGANMEARDNEGFTPFLMASLFGDTLVMNMLYKKGVDIYAINSSNQNALTLSIISNHIEAAKLLFRIGDKWSVSQSNAVDPFIVASKYRRKEMINLLEENNVTGRIKYGIDQMIVTASTRFCQHDLYPGISLSFKEPYLNGGFIVGFDMKLWYSRVLIQNSEQLFYQYMSKGSVAYAGLFKDFDITDRPYKLNYSFSTSLLAGYSFGNVLKGTLYSPDKKFMVIPSISLKMSKLNLSVIVGAEYIKTSYYKNGPVWFRVGCSYNYFFDHIRTRLKTINWH